MATVVVKAQLRSDDCVKRVCGLLLIGLHQIHLRPALIAPPNWSYHHFHHPQHIRLLCEHQHLHQHYRPLCEHHGSIFPANWTGITSVVSALLQRWSYSPWNWYNLYRVSRSFILVSWTIKYGKSRWRTRSSTDEECVQSKSRGQEERHDWSFACNWM